MGYRRRQWQGCTRMAASFVRFAKILVVSGIGVLSCTLALADVVTLTDGSRLVGIVEQLGDGTVMVTTDFAGKLEIDATKLVAIETERTVNVGLTTGDRLVGPIEWASQADQAVVHTGIGDIAVDLDKVAAIWPLGGKSPEVIAVQAQADAEREQIQAKVGKWSASVEAGAVFKEGNTDVLEARGRLELRKESSVDLLRLYLSGEYGEESKKRSTAEVKGGAYYEHMLGERFFAYIRSEAEYDEFENIDLRFTAALGGGYYWIKQDRHELKTRTGVGYLHESYHNGTSRDTAQLDLALEYRLDINEWLRFTHSTQYFPTFESVRDYRLVVDNALVIPLGNSDVWKFKLGALHEYDAIPQSGKDRLDSTYYGNLVMEIKQQ